jgi:VCBS repeat-containing protein
VAEDDTATTDEETPILIDVLDNDSDPDGNSALLTISDFSAVSDNGATITLIAGQLRYDPSSSPALRALQDGDTVVDSFTYEVTDQDGATSTATVFVTVTGISDAGAVTGRVFFDMNNNGVFDVFSDKPIGGVQVILTSTIPGFTPLSVISRGDGTYSFEGLSPGQYSVHEVHPEHALDGTDRPGIFGVVPGVPVNDVHTLNVPLDGTASGYNFAERGLTSDFISNGSVLNTTTAPGIVFAFNEDGGSEWFSFMAGWNGFAWAELEIADDLSTVTLTVYDADGNAQQATFPAIRPRFRFLGTNSEGYVVHVSGRATDFNFTPVSSPSTIPGSEGAVPLDPSAVDAALAGG